ncbi:MAG TPA: flagellar basal body rod protein FlgC [Rhizomicrobium sp.]
MEISRTALDVEWRRLEIVSENLANLNSARGASGALYKARHLVSGPRADFASHLDRAGDAIDLVRLGGVAVYGIEAEDAPPRLVHEPGNPRADAEGMVAYPAIDHAGQMLLLIKASRAYEANIVAMNAARQMYAKALDIGRRS